MALSTTLSGCIVVLTGRCRNSSSTQAGLDVNVELQLTSMEGTPPEGTPPSFASAGRRGTATGVTGNDPERSLANANVSILYSLGTVFDSRPCATSCWSWAPGRTQCARTNDLKRINSAKVFYRFSFSKGVTHRTDQTTVLSYFTSHTAAVTVKDLAKHIKIRGKDEFGLSGI